MFGFSKHGYYSIEATNNKGADKTASMRIQYQKYIDIKYEIDLMSGYDIILLFTCALW